MVPIPLARVVWKLGMHHPYTFHPKVFLAHLDEICAPVPIADPVSLYTVVPLTSSTACV
jgi:hypothetical protein